EAIAGAIRLGSPSTPGEEPRFLDLPGEFVLRDPPVLRIETPLASDLAHRVEVEVEGIPGRFPAGRVVVAGQGGASTPTAPIEVSLGPIADLPSGAIDRPGELRIRVVLQPDPGLGWADPDVRSLWPGTIET